MATQQRKAAPAAKVYKHVKPEFTKIGEGQSIEGVFLGDFQSQFGIAYRIRTGEGIKCVGGNRYQLDAILADMRSDSEAFPKGLEGHLIRITRLTDEKLKGGHSVGRYEVSHVFEGCPMGCIPF